MSRNYKFHDSEAVYFVSFAVINWVNIFTIHENIEILLQGLRYSQEAKGLEIYAWCIMPNHIHLVFRSVNGKNPGKILGEFKSYTNRRIIEALKNSSESTSISHLAIFSQAAKKSSNVKGYQLWVHNNHPIELSNNYITRQKIEYTHQNPVKAGLVAFPEDYPYSSARDYAGLVGLIEGVIVVRNY